MLSLLRPRLSQPLYKELVSCIPSFRSFSANMMMENQPSLPSIFTHLHDQIDLTPREVVTQLDQYIIGQAEAKRAVAIALRNRWRRQRLPQDLIDDVVPKNILMVGPTGSGKTEIARRLAKIDDSPFIKVEATKFTEVGFHGKDVDSIIKDLVEVGLDIVKKKLKSELEEQAAPHVEKTIMAALLGESFTQEPEEQQDSWVTLYRSGELDNRLITIDMPLWKPSTPKMEGPGANVFPIELLGGLENSIKKMAMKRAERKRVTVAEAREALLEYEVEKLMESRNVQEDAVTLVEQQGIVFLDELDKIVSSKEYRGGADASDEGVQRDLLPLVEGSTVSTKYGNVRTDYILFICSGAFHQASPSDLLAELQGRLPIRVTLDELKEEHLYRILTEPVNNLVRQQVELMKTEGVELEFSEEALREIARMAADMNRTVENIGARRLHTIIEKIMDEISFDAPTKKGEKVLVSKELIEEKLEGVIEEMDVSRYIL